MSKILEKPNNGAKFDAIFEKKPEKQIISRNLNKNMTKNNIYS